MQTDDLPEGAWDSHIHVIDPHNFALSPDREYTPKAATKYDARAFHRRLGITDAVIVQPSVYGVDNNCLLDALASSGGKAVGVCVIDPHSITDRMLAKYQAAGVRGIRVNLGNGSTQKTITAAVLTNAAIARKMDWVIQLWIPQKAWVYLHDLIPQLGVVVVVDHFGHAEVGSKTGKTEDSLNPFRREGFREFIDLIERGLLYAKLSAPYQNSRAAPKFEDMQIVTEKILAAGPDMVVFGSDWPHTSSKEGNAKEGGRLTPQEFRDIDDVAVMDVIKSWCGSEMQVRKLFVDNPCRLWTGSHSGVASS